MQYFDIVIHQTRVALRQDTQRLFLGMAWWFLEPLLYVLTFYILFSSGLRFGGGGIETMINVVVGVSIFRFFSGSLPGAASSLVNNRGLMNQVALPKWIFPIQNLLFTFIKFCFLLLVMVGYMAFSGVSYTVHGWGFFFILLVYVLLTMGLSLVASALVPFFPDLRLLITNIITFLFFLSGVFYDIRSFSPEVQEIFYLNPFAVIIQSVRNVFILNTWPMWERLLVIGFYSIVIIFIGFKLLDKFNFSYPKLTRG